MSDDEIKICNNCKHYIRSTAFPKRGICFYLIYHLIQEKKILVRSG